MKYGQVSEGEWIQPIRHGYKMACCSCGMVHRMNMRLVGKKYKKIQIQLFRDNRATAQIRRKRK